MKRVFRDNASWLNTFETNVGMKYRFGGFDSGKFNQFVEEEFSFESSGLSLHDFVLPPDLLRDKYTSCGHIITESVHLELMKDLAQNELTRDSNYISRARNGTLDARMPFECKLEFLRGTFGARVKALQEGELFTIYVLRVLFREKCQYVIADGKHRTALVAYFQKPQALRIRLISSSFAQELFFRKIYSHVLRLNPTEYSINQEMIKAIYDNES